MKNILAGLWMIMALGAATQDIPYPEIAEIAKIRHTDCDSALMLAKKLRFKQDNPSADYNAYLYQQIGLAHYCLGQFDEALKSYQRAIDGFQSASNTRMEVSVLNLIGTLHKKQGEMQKSLEYFQQGLAKARKTRDTLEQGNSLNNIGIVYLQTDSLKQALDYFLRSTELKASVHDTVGLSYNYDNLGMTYNQLGQFEKSKAYFDLAAEYKQMIGDRIGYAIVQNNIGEMYLQAEQFAKAEPYFLKALEIATSTQYRDFKQYIFKMLSTLKEAQGQYKASLDYHKKHVALKDSLFNEQKSRQLAEIETQYQTEKKEREIQLQQAEIGRKNILLASTGSLVLLLVIIGVLGRNRLKLKNQNLLEEARRKAREAEIQAVITSQEKERNRFARDMHDGLGQLISSIRLSLENINKQNKEERDQTYQHVTQVIDEMHQELKNICFDLMPQTLMKQGLQAALEEFTFRVRQSSEKALHFEAVGVQQELLTEVQVISLYRIAQEWTNNILKYSEADKITIQLTADESEITLLIEDDGMGFDKSSLENSQGHGWKNIASRTHLISGDVELDTVPGQRGNTFILNAPLVMVAEKEVAA